MLLPPCTPWTDQTTPVLLVPETVAVNCSDVLPCTVAVVGEMVTLTAPPPALMVTVAEADLDGSAKLLAVTETEPPGGIDSGAVYRPALVIVPYVEFPFWTPLTYQVTPVFESPETVAENWWVERTCSPALLGDTETLTEEPTVPISGTDIGVGAFDVTDREPVKLPVVPGANATTTCPD